MTMPERDHNEPEVAEEPQVSEERSYADQILEWRTQGAIGKALGCMKDEKIIRELRALSVMLDHWITGQTTFDDTIYQSTERNGREVSEVFFTKEGSVIPVGSERPQMQLKMSLQIDPSNPRVASRLHNQFSSTEIPNPADLNLYGDLIREYSVVVRMENVYRDEADNIQRRKNTGIQFRLRRDKRVQVSLIHSQDSAQGLQKVDLTRFDFSDLVLMGRGIQEYTKRSPSA